jgi:hypothetical protein
MRLTIPSGKGAHRRFVYQACPERSAIDVVVEEIGCQADYATHARNMPQIEPGRT